MNKHRGSDFNEFIIEENLMTPTPRTDAIAHRGLGSVAYIAEMTSLARQLERELAERAESWRVSSVCRSKEARIARLELDLAAERALADRLAYAAIDLRQLLRAHGQGCGTGREDVAAWKDARQ